MLILSRKPEQSIQIGENICIKVVRVRGDVVRLGFVAPDDVKIMRSELIEKDRAKAAKLAEMESTSNENVDGIPSQDDSQPDSDGTASAILIFNAKCRLAQNDLHLDTIAS